MILLIGNGTDPHLFAIQKELVKLEKRSTILDTSKEGLLETDFSYCSENNLFCIQQENNIVDLKSVDVVFCASPLYARKGFVSTQEKDFWHFTWRESLYGYFANLADKTFFVNKNIPTGIAAQNKIIFFKCAESVGLLTPKSLMSNNKEQIEKFFNTHKDVLIKTMHQIYLEYNGAPTMMLVKKVNYSQFSEFNGIGECPVFLQQAIDKKFDLRIIIVGNKVFGCKIDASQSIYGKQDWRAYDLPNTIHSIYEVPEILQSQLLELMNKMQLNYACLDLCVDHNDDYWLLDINPFGKYMWIELATGLSISKEIAYLLCKLNDE